MASGSLSNALILGLHCEHKICGLLKVLVYHSKFVAQWPCVGYVVVEGRCRVFGFFHWPKQCTRLGFRLRLGTGTYELAMSHAGEHPKVMLLRDR